ncbi:V-type ATPase assembly factor Pkr1p [Monosporozyma servazzii]
MTDFFTGLWNSAFQPGTTPQLIIATHVSFVALLLTLAWLIYATNGNIHFIALFFIAAMLWLAIIWFIEELKSVKLKSNDELFKDDSNASVKNEDSKNEEKREKENSTTTPVSTSTSTSATPSKNVRSRKV